MMLNLSIRTPQGLLYLGPVTSVTAEAADGWFGLAPGHEDLVVVLAAGLFLLRDAKGEAFVATEGGLLNLAAGQCHIMVRSAVMTRRLEDITPRIEQHLAERRSRVKVQHDVMDELAREARRRLAAGWSS